MMVACRARRSVAHWAFIVGMLTLAAESAFYGFTLNTLDPAGILVWQNRALIALSFLPGIWLLFSLTYARGNYREFLTKWNVPLVCAFVLPVMVAVLFQGEAIVSIADPRGDRHWLLRLGLPGVVLALLALLGAVLVLMNLERTYRSSVGTMRWRIKFMVIGLGVIFAALVYTTSQIMLFRAIDLSLPVVFSAALLVGCGLIVRSLLREGHFNTDVYPSQAVLQNSFTAFVVGIYLLIIGVFAKVIAFLGGDASFTLKAFTVLVGLVVLSLIVLSDRVRLRARRFVSRHFQRPFYDYRTIWWKFTQGTARHVEEGDLCAETVKLVSEIFQALSVTIWLLGDSRQKLSLAASTSFSAASPKLNWTRTKPLR